MINSKKMHRIITVFIAVVLMLCMGTSALAAIQARINSSAARVYNVPSTASKIYVSGGKGITVNVTGYANGWARVTYRGNTGYIQGKYLNLANRLTAYTAKSTPVYRSASSSSGRLGTLSLGTAVYVVGKSGSYFRVQNASGSVTGYVPAANLTSKSKLQAAYNAYVAYKKAQAAANSSSSSSGSTSTGTSSGSSSSSGSSGSGSGTTVSSKIDMVIALAKSYLNRPYAENANPPASFNCSIFVKYCMEIYGYDMESTAAKQAAMSNKVSKSNIQKGDVLCFDTNGDGTCDHTAIYMGSSKFIEASQKAGKVQINDLDSTYKGYLMWAIRPK